MNENIYISPSSQPANSYAVGNTNEQEQCRKIAAALDKELTRCGFNSKAGMSGTMYTRVAESNAFGADLHMPIHTNGFDGTVAGLRIMVYKKGGEAEQIAKAIMATLAPITPGKSDGISVYPGLYEIEYSNAICVYIEVGFHDNPEEAQWIIDHTQDIAVAIAKGLCNHYGVRYVPANMENKPEVKPSQKPTEKPVEKEMIYRVYDESGKQLGAYKVEEYAFNKVKEQLRLGGGARITYSPK